MADRRLAEGPFSMSTEILSAPETIAAGDSLTLNDLVRKLERSGYTRSTGNPGGSFAVQANSVQIMPGTSSPAGKGQVQFAQDKISSIVSLTGPSAAPGIPAGFRVADRPLGAREAAPGALQ
jgi:transcription-repair coupling factor (superfamily II helicase)